MIKSDLAIIIPTLNEEHYVGALLDSIAHQTVQPKDVIVVDAESQDGTVNEIKKRKTLLPNLKIVSCKKYSIARQRNRGVEQTKATQLLFLDADVVFPGPHTLEVYMSEVERKKLAVAASSNIPQSWYWKDVVYFWALNVLFRLMRYIWPMALGMNLYVRRDAFKICGGFDEEIRIGEDIEFVQRVMKKGFTFNILDNATMHASVRRLKKEGRRKFSKKMLRSFWYVRKHGFHNNPTDYEFGNYNSL